MATAPLYKPPTRVTTAATPFEALVQSADPGWARSKFWAIEYIFQRRAFEANPYQRGAYNRLSNIYAVGQAYGQPDPLVIAALAPTVGVSTPGLFQGVPDGKGWG